MLHSPLNPGFQIRSQGVGTLTVSVRSSWYRTCSFDWKTRVTARNNFPDTLCFGFEPGLTRHLRQNSQSLQMAWLISQHRIKPLATVMQFALTSSQFRQRHRGFGVVWLPADNYLKAFLC